MLLKRVVSLEMTLFTYRQKEKFVNAIFHVV